MNNLTNYKSIAVWFLIITSTAIVLYSNITVLNVPTFADGTQHSWINRYVTTTGNLPPKDITGIQASNFAIPRSIADSEPFLYQPLYYVLTSAISLSTNTSEFAIPFLSIISIFLTGIFLYLITKELSNKKIGLIIFLATIFSNIWPWLTVHRIVEPLILCLTAAVLYFMFMYLRGRRIFIYPLVICTICLVGVKMTTLPIMLSVILTVLLFGTLKEKVAILAFSFFLYVPFIYFSLKTIHALTPNPTGISYVDSYFKNAWWNQKPDFWEDELNTLVDAKSLQKRTYAQFQNVQQTPSVLFANNGLSGIINQFSLYPTSSRSAEGYQSLIPGKMAPFIILIYVLSVIFIIKKRNYIMRDKPFITFALILFTATFGLWLKQPVFRYYMYITLLSLPILAAGIYFSITNTNKLLKIILPTICFGLFILNLKNEVARDLNFMYTAMHRNLPTTEGGLEDSIRLGEIIQNDPDSGEYVFTPMVEIAYYSKKKFLWDNRLFFVEDTGTLQSVLRNYDFKYVVMPFYSGSTKKDNWLYYQGAPSDSVFNLSLSDKTLYKVIESNNTFTAYKKLPDYQLIL